MKMKSSDNKRTMVMECFEPTKTKKVDIVFIIYEVKALDIY